MNGSCISLGGIDKTLYSERDDTRVTDYRNIAS